MGGDREKRRKGRISEGILSSNRTSNDVRRGKEKNVCCFFGLMKMETVWNFVPIQGCQTYFFCQPVPKWFSILSDQTNSIEPKFYFVGFFTVLYRTLSLLRSVRCVFRISPPFFAKEPFLGPPPLPPPDPSSTCPPTTFGDSPPQRESRRPYPPFKRSRALITAETNIF